jgi:O-antigen/teichoic acid export membrane protein
VSLKFGALIRLRRSDFVKNVAVLMSGTAMGQAITLAAAPVLSRLYSPDDFGVLGLYVAASMILGAAASWKYNIAIVLPKDDADAANVLALSCLLVVFMAISTAVVLALAEDWIIQVLDNAALEMFIWWLPFSVIIGGSYGVIMNWANRYKEYKKLALYEVLRSGGIAGAQALASLARLGPAGLIAGSMAGSSLAIIMLGWRVCYRHRGLNIRSITVGKMADMAREHYHFPVYNLPQALLVTSSRSLPIFLFTFIFDPAVAGLYWFTARIVSAPGRLFAGSAGRVFYQKAASKLHRGEEILPHLRSVTLVLSAIGILPVAILWAFGRRFW